MKRLLKVLSVFVLILSSLFISNINTVNGEEGINPEVVRGYPKLKDLVITPSYSGSVNVKKHYITLTNIKDLEYTLYSRDMDKKDEWKLEENYNLRKDNYNITFELDYSMYTLGIKKEYKVTTNKKENKEYYANVYSSGTNYGIRVLEVSNEFEFEKLVKGESGKYSRSDSVKLGSEYSYKYKVKMGHNLEPEFVANGISSHYIGDILENENDGWKGTLKEIKVINNELTYNSYESIKIYYSTDTDLSYDNIRDFNTGSQTDRFVNYRKTINWQETMPEDKSKITAFKVELPKSLDSRVNIGKEIEIEAVMEAPKTFDASKLETVNKAKYMITILGGKAMSDGDTYAQSSLKTNLNLNIKQDLVINKKQLDDNNKEIPLSNASFTLYKCDEDHNHVGKPGEDNSCFKKVKDTLSNENGVVNFNDLDNGNYAVVENKLDKYKDTNTYWLFNVNNENQEVKYIGAYSFNNSKVKEIKEENNQYILVNDREDFDINIKKIWKDSKVNRPQTITFDLYRNDTLIETKEVKVTKDEETYQKIFKDKYVYDVNGNKYTYKVVERDVKGYKALNNNIEVDKDVIEFVNKEDEIKVKKENKKIVKTGDYNSNSYLMLLCLSLILLIFVRYRSAH